MKRNPFLAGILSLLIPGLGQMYVQESGRGAAILAFVIIAGNLNAIWLSAFAISNAAPATFWGHTLPRLLHDVFALYGVIFWVWQVIDAYCLAKVAIQPE